MRRRLLRHVLGGSLKVGFRCHEIKFHGDLWRVAHRFGRGLFLILALAYILLVSIGLRAKQPHIHQERGAAYRPQAVQRLHDWPRLDRPVRIPPHVALATVALASTQAAINWGDSVMRPIDGAVVYAIIQLFVICESNAGL